MNSRPVTIMFSTLGLVCLAFVCLFTIVVVVSLFGDRQDSAGFRKKYLYPWRLEIMTLVALTSMAGSLIMSEVFLFVPCLLCWIQRGFMYPAALILLAESVAVNTKGKGISQLVGIGKVRLGIVLPTVLSGLGLVVAVFHRYEQAAGTSLNYCSADTPCSQKWFEHFGFVTIPTLAAIGFATVLVLGLTYLDRPKSDK